MWFKYKLEELFDYVTGDSKKRKAERLIEALNQIIAEEEQKRKEKEEQDKISKELVDIFAKWRIDWSENPYSDKITTPTIDGKTTYCYKFEDGDCITLYNDGRLKFESKTEIINYRLGLIWRGHFIDYANKTVLENNLHGKKRPANKPFGNQSEHASHPKWAIYQSLVITVASRKEQLANCKNTEKQMMENELKAAIGRMEAMKQKYNF